MAVEKKIKTRESSKDIEKRSKELEEKLKKDIKDDNDKIVRTKKKLSKKAKVLLTILFIIIFFVVYITNIEPKNITSIEYAITNELIPKELNGLKIVYFSDLYYGNTITDKELENLTNRINEVKPDIVLFGGDLISNDIKITEEIKESIKNNLSKINSNLKKYYVLGDIDYKNKDIVEDILTTSGFKNLTQNRKIFYNNSKTPILLTGINSITKEDTNIEDAFKKDIEGNYYQILVAHEPIIANKVFTKSNLILVGHTLGGTIKLPFINNGIINKDNVGSYVNGKYEESNTSIYVSNGIGTDSLKVRLFNTPSFEVLRLYNN